MSVDQIAEELKQMTRAERRQIAQVLYVLDGQDEKVPQAKDFTEAKAYVFDNYGELLRRLAQ